MSLFKHLNYLPHLTFTSNTSQRLAIVHCTDPEILQKSERTKATLFKKKKGKFSSQLAHSIDVG